MSSMARSISSSVISSWLIVTPITFVSANASMSGTSLADRRHRDHREVAEHLALRGVLHDHAGGLAAAEDVGGRDVGGVAERPLALDDDHVGVLPLERRHHLVLDLARAELGDERVERHAVLAALDQGGLTRADQDGLHARGR